MPSYFLALAADLFEVEIRPALTASRREKSFRPLQLLCAHLLPTAASSGVADLGQLLQAVLEGVSYDRHLWRAVTADILLLSAVEVPEIRLAPRTLCHLLKAGAGEGPREGFTPIEQALFGSRELSLGPYSYRPLEVGLNDPVDVDRLAAYLAGVDPTCWQSADLPGEADLDALEREEELEFVKQGLAELDAFYRRSGCDRFILCE